VELELHFFEPVGYVFIIDAANKDFPGVCMIGWRIFRSVCGVEWDCFGAVDEGTVNLDALITVNFVCAL
jgi:hypothetical protein